MKKNSYQCAGACLALSALVGLSACGKSNETGSAPDKASSSSAAAAEAAPLFDFKTLDHTILKRREGAPPTVIFPAELTAEDNKRISIVGFMAPFEEMDNMKRFMLLPSYVGCFFCSPPSFTQVVLVEQKSKGEGKLPFINEPIMVTGTLRLYSKDSKHPAHLAEFIYALDDAEVQVYNGANVPKRAAGHQQTGRLLGTLQQNQNQNQTPPNSATPHKAFQPQFLINAVSDLRRLPMMQALKFMPLPLPEITKKVSEQIASRYSAPQWRARERACVALGFADKTFDLPHAIASLETLRLPGYYDPASQVIFYEQGLQFSQPDSRLHMVKLITEALLTQNAASPATPPVTDDALMAAAALRRGDVERTALLYDQKTRLEAARPEPLAPGPEVPMLLDKYSGIFNRKAQDFVTQVFPPDQLDKLNNAYAKPPTSTAEILHPDYFLNSSSWHPDPVKWENEDLQGAQPLLSGELGEAALTVWISRFSHDEATPEGWSGDRFAVWDGGSEGDSWVMETHWAQAEGAEHFFKATQSLGELMLHARLTDEKKDSETYTASSDRRTFRSVLRKDHKAVAIYCAKKEAEAAELEAKFVKP